MLRLYRDLRKQIGVFCSDTLSWDTALKDKLFETTRSDFRWLKRGTSQKKFTKFMTAKRELMYDLRDANMTIADAEEPLR